MLFILHYSIQLREEVPKYYTSGLRIFLQMLHLGNLCVELLHLLNLKFNSLLKLQEIHFV